MTNDCIHYIGIDLGGTRIKGVIMDRDGHILEQRYTPTADGEGQPWKAAVKETVRYLKDRHVQGDCVIGVSAPGIPAADNHSISVMPDRLQGLEGFHWGDYLGEATWVCNDAIAALAAEARFGAARDCRHAVMITLGTGVGGAILIDGHVYQGAFQKAGHIGHMSVDPDGPADICGMPGSLEDAIGNCTIAQRTGGRFQSTQALLDAHRVGDPQATQTWMTSIRKLAIALAGITNILSPEKIIIGGGIAEAGDDLFLPLDQLLRQFEWQVGGQSVTLCKAQFGDIAGALGAASFALMKQQPA